jgi:hypothetical protein
MFDLKPTQLGQGWSWPVVPNLLIREIDHPMSVSLLPFASACYQWTQVLGSRGPSGSRHSGTVAALRGQGTSGPHGGAQLVRCAGAWTVAHAGAQRLRGVMLAPATRTCSSSRAPWNRALVRSGRPCWSRSRPVNGAIEAVGADYLELAEDDPGEARRRTAVKARRFVGFAAVVAVTLPPAPR